VPDLSKAQSARVDRRSTRRPAGWRSSEERGNARIGRVRELGVSTWSNSSVRSGARQWALEDERARRKCIVQVLQR